MKKICLLHITLILSLGVMPLFGQSANSFDWQIQFLKGQELESLQVNEVIRLDNGNIFRLNVQTAVDSYCYIICYDSERKITVLHNQLLRRGSPQNFGPLRVTEPSGTSTIYVIMSRARQSNLETLIERQNNNQNSRQHINNLYREIVNLQNTISSLGEPASRIIPSGGTTRSTANNFATQFSGKNAYVRAITIRH